MITGWVSTITLIQRDNSYLDRCGIGFNGLRALRRAQVREYPAMSRFGEAAGALYGLVVGLGFLVTFATPQQWQKRHGIGASSVAARQRAVRLYPI